MTPFFTKSGIYEPNEIDVNGNTFVKLTCESNTQFITSISNITCKVGVRSMVWNYTNIDISIQASYGDDTVIWGCWQNGIENITAGVESSLYPCGNVFYNNTLARPSTKIFMRLASFKGNTERFPVDKSDISFDRPIEVMSRNEELNIEISRNSLFIATISLIVLTVLEFRKFIKSKY